MLKFIILILLINFVTIIVYLLVNKFIGSFAFSSLFTVFLLCSIATFAIDRLEMLDLKNLRMTLREMKEVQEDVVAREERVSKLSKAVYKTSSGIISKLGYWDSAYSVDELIEFRNTFKTVLFESNTDKAEVKALLSPIDERIQADATSELIKEVEKQALEQSKKQSLDLPFEKLKQDLRLLVGKENPEQLLEYLKEHNLANEKIAPLIQRQKALHTNLKVDF